MAKIWNRSPESADWNLRVKVCRVSNCSYVERKKTNNMKYHYVFYHDDLKYPNKPFNEVEISSANTVVILQSFKI